MQNHRIAALLAASATLVAGAASAGVPDPQTAFRVFYGHVGGNETLSVPNPGAAHLKNRPPNKSVQWNGSFNTYGVEIGHKLSNGWIVGGELAGLNGHKPFIGGTASASGEYGQIRLGRTVKLDNLKLTGFLIGSVSSFNAGGSRQTLVRPGGLLKAHWHRLTLRYAHLGYVAEDSTGNRSGSPHTVTLGYTLPFHYEALRNLEISGGYVVPELDYHHDGKFRYSVSNGWLVDVKSGFRFERGPINHATVSLAYIGGLEIHDQSGLNPGLKTPVAPQAGLPYDPASPTQSYVAGVQANIAASGHLGGHRVRLALAGGWNPTRNSNVPSSGGTIQAQTSSWNVGTSLRMDF